MKLYIDPGTGSMLFAILIGIIGALNFALRGWIIKLRFLLSRSKRGSKQTCLRLKATAHYQKVIDHLMKVVFRHPPGEQLLIEKIPVTLWHHACANTRARKHHTFCRQGFHRFAHGGTAHPKLLTQLHLTRQDAARGIFTR